MPTLLVSRSPKAAAAAAAARAAAQKQAEAEQAAQLASVVRQIGGTSQAATQAANQAAASAGGPTVTTAGAPSSGAGAGAVAFQAAESQLGVPYVWGGETPRGTPGDPSGGFDCSGLTQWAWAQAGVSIPRTSEVQYADLPRVWTASSHTSLSLATLQPGDLFLYYNLDGTGTVDHVAMYAGGDTLIQAPFTGTVVRYVPIYTSGLTAVARP